jgi:uncharacterized membrane protein YdbT with pleckstrin-like domain
MNDFSAYRTLGTKTFWVMVLQRSQGLFVLLLLVIALSAVGSAGPDIVPLQYTWITGLGVLGAAILFLVGIVGVLVISWLIYSNYKFALTDDALRISRGILNKEEVSIPYRQIQDINVMRMLPDRFLGVSRVVIMTAGEEDKNDHGPVEAEGVLPVLDKTLAEELVQELSRRADVQRVVNIGEVKTR